MARDAATDHDAMLAQVLAEQAIGKVVADYGRGIDELDFDRVRGCFHPDATIQYGGDPQRPLDEAIAWLEDVLPAIFALSHYFGPSIVDLSESHDRAVCQTWCINVNQYPRGRNGSEKQTISGLLYDDVFACRDGRWRILERRNRTEWNVEVDGNTRLPLPG